MNVLTRLITDDRGQDMVEYGLLAAFLSIIAIAAAGAIGPLLRPVYQAIANALP